MRSLFLTLSLLLLSAPVLACVAAPELRIDLENGPISVDASHNLDGVSALYDVQNLPPIAANMRTVGLYLARNQITVAGEYRAFSEADGSRCLLLDGLTLNLRLEDRIIYIPRELAMDECAYQVILDHELQHARVSEQAMDDTREELRRRMPRFLAEQASRRLAAEDDPNAAMDDVTLEISAFADEIMRFHNERAKAAHALIDDPTRVRAEQAQCGRTFGEILRRAE